MCGIYPLARAADMPGPASMQGQGATEYLVLLAVVLIIGLVSIALLGYSSGAASDIALSESQVYWKGATPIAIVETGEAYRFHGTYPDPPWNLLHNASGANLHIRNTGSSPLTITKILGAGASVSIDVTDVQVVINGSDVSQWHPISITIQPGEDSCIGTAVGTVQGSFDDIPCRQHEISFLPAGVAGGPWGTLAAASTYCDWDGNGFITIESFGFEYNVLAEGQTVTKKQVGTKPLIIRCIGWCNETTGFDDPTQLCFHN